ncbi:hypothetical protein F2Q69_00007683 [Brassica cretica]|uniref:Uncharacterized protein n=1 Tax=Brassica cretica TaxID=69181 RepID=A0A8S9PA50_BRACR|nr:hypothetical protein F2Q69_00007683 [Brassica cretica]
MGTRNCTRRESALHSDVEALRWAMENMLQFNMPELWDRLQGAECNDRGTSCLTKFCDIIGDDRDATDMLFGLQYHSCSTSTQ